MKHVIFLTGLFLSATTFAQYQVNEIPLSLSPYWDSVKQIETILESKEVSDISGPVTGIAISSTNSLTYELTTQGCTLTVTLDRQIPDGPGATTYKVNTVKQVCQQGK
ncbi:MAG: hypothetical protein C5B49_11060 [Bdellovibrio sp.]|nr:MAG: hypothetical protein C5B49_11060 [Bdellovibrio sp.]